MGMFKHLRNNMNINDMIEHWIVYLLQDEYTTLQMIIVHYNLTGRFCYHVSQHWLDSVKRCSGHGWSPGRWNYGGAWEGTALWGQARGTFLWRGKCSYEYPVPQMNRLLWDNMLQSQLSHDGLTRPRMDTCVRLVWKFCLDDDSLFHSTLCRSILGTLKTPDFLVILRI